MSSKLTLAVKEFNGTRRHGRCSACNIISIQLFPNNATLEISRTFHDMLIPTTMTSRLSFLGMEGLASP